MSKQSAGRVLLLPKGDYAAATTYAPLDVVTYEKDSYVCKQAAQGILPTNTTYWQPLTSVGDDIDNLTSAITTMNNDLGAKNVLTLTRDDLLEFNTGGTWTGDSYAWRGVTFACTFNDAGYLTKVTASGTASSSLPVLQLIGDSAHYQKNAYKGMFFKGCPSGGSGSSYSVSVRTATDSSGSGSVNTSDTGSGVTVGDDDYIRLFIRVEANYAITGSLEFNLMITPKAVYDIDSTWKNPSKTNQALTADVVSLQDNEEVNGAVNMLPNTASTSVSNGITCTVGSDGTMTLTSDGTTRTGNTDFQIYANFPLKDGMTYKLSGCPSGGSTTDSGYRLALRNYDTDTGEGVVITANSSTGLAKDVLIRVGKDYVFNGAVVFKPMITVPTYNGDYVPYAKSNKELTADVATVTESAAQGVSAYGGTLAVTHIGVTANVATQIISKRGVYLALFTFYDVASAAYLINVDSVDSSKCFATELAAPPSGVTITFDFSTAGKAKVTADHSYRARVITIADANY